MVLKQLGLRTPANLHNKLTMYLTIWLAYHFHIHKCCIAIHIASYVGYLGH